MVALFRHNDSFCLVPYIKTAIVKHTGILTCLEESSQLDRSEVMVSFERTDCIKTAVVKGVVH
jgi:hypothetical protein